MTGELLGTLGKSLAERWLSLLVLPGAVYLAVATAAHVLGHQHAWDLGRLTDQITHWAQAPAVRTTGGQVVLLAAVLAGAAVAGLAAQSLGSLVERLALAADWQTWAPPLRQLARWRVTRRQARWNAARAAYAELLESAGQAAVHGRRRDAIPRYTAYRTMTHIADERPDRPTWSGDRIHAAAVRLDRDYHLDLATIWPYLWLNLPDAVRVEITNARTGLTRATTLGGWAMLYALLIFWWWPAALVTAVLAALCWQRIRVTADTHATLLEAATRLHTSELARQLGVEHTTPLTPHIGDVLTDLLHARQSPVIDD